MDQLAVTVLSGGLDSATALGIAVQKHGHDNVRTITFEYGQKHANEVEAAQALCDYYRVPQTVVPLPTDLFRGGVLTTDAEVPDMKYSDLPDGVMSPTYVPFRNGNLLSMSAAYADTLLREDDSRWQSALLYAGMHAEDAAGFAYADCTPEFLGAMAAAIHIGTYGRVRLQALFQFTTKADIIRLGMSLRVPYHLTRSCYRGDDLACGTCATCQARLEAFTEAGFFDPAEYAVPV